MKKTFVILGLIFAVFLFFSPVLAETFTTDGPNIGLEYGRATGLGTEDVRFTVAMIIRVALGLLGIISTVIIIYAGFTWMTAGGNEEQAGKARKILISAVIGLAIIMSAYSIVRFLGTSLFKATTGSDYIVTGDNF